MLLVGDIGGTKTRLSLYKYDHKWISIKDKTFFCRKFSNLQEVITEFLNEEKCKIERAAFGIAGPVREGRCEATNLPWVIDVKDLAKLLKTSNVYLLNDLEAKAYGFLELGSEDFFVINEGVPHTGNAALVAPGTGLGEAGLFWDGKKHKPFACEGGHTDFAPRNALEIELLCYLQKKYGHVSYERIVSGPGLLNLYQFFLDTNRITKFSGFDKVEPPLLPNFITQKGLSKEDLGCEMALDLFISIFGAEVSNVALKFFAVSGIYLGGGIPPVIAKKLKKQTIFMDAYEDKGRFSSLVSSIPIKVIMNDQISLIGAASFATLNNK